MMSPGTYLQKRRVAAGLAIVDVAAMVRTSPHWGEIDRVAWIGRIEQDIAALSPDVIATLSDAFRFSRTVLLQLITLRNFGPDAGDGPRICIGCACTERDPCCETATGETCAWSTEQLCTSCTALPKGPHNPKGTAA